MSFTKEEHEPALIDSQDPTKNKPADEKPKEDPKLTCKEMEKLIFEKTAELKGKKKYVLQYEAWEHADRI